MIQISNSIEIRRPVLQVFDYIADFENNPRWMPVESVQPVTPGAVSDGTRYIQRFQLMGAEYQVDCVITKFEPPSKISFEYQAPVFHWRGDYLLEPTPNGTRLSAKGNVALGGPFKMAETIFAPKIRRLISETAPNLKKILES